MMFVLSHDVARNRARAALDEAPAGYVIRITPGPWEYQSFSPVKLRESKSPVMDALDMTEWLNDMNRRGWELVTYGQKNWMGSEPFTQDWWIFRRPIAKARGEA